MERHEWEEIAVEVASMIDVHTGPLLAFERVRYGRKARVRSTKVDSMERDFWRGWVAWIARPDCAAYADACVRNEDAYAAGALARMLHEDALAEPSPVTCTVERRGPGDFEMALEFGDEDDPATVERVVDALADLMDEDPAIGYTPSVFACVRCGTTSGPHQSCECGANDRPPEIVEVCT